VLGADGDTDAVLGHTRVETFLLAQLLVCCGPGMNCKSFRVADAARVSYYTDSIGRNRPTLRGWKSV
jgi:hypothetical protein